MQLWCQKGKMFNLQGNILNSSSPSKDNHDKNIFSSQDSSMLFFIVMLYS